MRRPQIGYSWSRLRAALLADDGVSAVEFALFAPILFFSLLATTDLGFALYERMTIDHVLRAGVQSAMADPGAATVLEDLQKTAANDPILAGNPPAFSVTSLFACPKDPTVLYPNPPTCAGSVPPYRYYRLSAEKNYDGIFVPIRIGSMSLGTWPLGSAAQVQVR